MAIRITVETSSVLATHLPVGSVGNEAEIEVQEGATPHDVIQELHLPSDEFYLVMYNGTLLPNKARSDTRLAEGDRLGIFPPLKSG